MNAMTFSQIYRQASDAWLAHFSNYVLKQWPESKGEMTPEFKAEFQNCFQEAMDPHQTARQVCAKYFGDTTTDTSLGNEVATKVCYLLRVMNTQDRVAALFPRITANNGETYKKNGELLKELAGKTEMCIQDCAVSYLDQMHPEWRETKFTERELKTQEAMMQPRVNVMGPSDGEIMMGLLAQAFGDPDSIPAQVMRNAKG